VKRTKQTIQQDSYFLVHEEVATEQKCTHCAVFPPTHITWVGCFLLGQELFYHCSVGAVKTLFGFILPV